MSPLDRRDFVRTGAAVGGSVEVLDGLREGEQVVVKGNERIQPGASRRAARGAARGRELAVNVGVDVGVGDRKRVHGSCAGSTSRP